MKRAFLSLTVLVVVVSGFEASGYHPAPTPRLLRRIDAAGPMWYSARLALPAKTSYATDLRVVAGTGATIGCYLFQRDEVGGKFRRDILWPPGEVGNDLHCADTTPARRDPVILDVVMLLVSSEPTQISRLVLRASEGVRVLAESWGSEVAVIDLDDFAQSGGTSARAEEPLWAQGGFQFRRPVQAGALAGSSVVARFAGSPFIDMWARSYLPSKISISGPLGTQEHVWKIRVPGGVPGRYRFNVDAFAGADALNSERSPFVIVAVADVDYPACRTRPARSSGADGHPICA